MFEELKGADYKRECLDEMCDLEELREIYPDNQAKRESTWKQLTEMCKNKPCDPVGSIRCTQNWNSRTCLCKTGFEGDDCATDKDECKKEPSPCGDKACTNTQGSFKCACANGYAAEGEKCKDIDECLENPCVNGQCQNSEGTFSCDCHAGWVGIDCKEDIDECKQDGTCAEGMKCANSEGSFSCTCDKEGFEAADDGSCVDIDECTGINAITCTNGKCDNKDGGYECACNKGYHTGVTESGQSQCVDIDECKLETHNCGNATCFDMPGSFVCCEESTHNLDLVTGDCTLIEPCKGKKCHEQGLCTANDDQECQCATKYQPTPDAEGNCVDFDECATPETNNCAVGTLCMNDAPGFHCEEIQKAPQCAPGFEMTEHWGCQDIDECQGEDNGGCADMCMNLWGSKKCYSDILEEQMICHHYSVVNASNTEYGYSCGCYEGYSLCEDGFTCTCKTNDYTYVKAADAPVCDEDQIAISGTCFFISKEAATYDGAEKACNEIDGTLAKISDRRTWWDIGNNVGPSAGYSTFWINKVSDSKSANIIALGEATAETGLAANLPENMGHVAPQWDFVSASKEYLFVCQV